VFACLLPSPVERRFGDEALRQRGKKLEGLRWDLLLVYFFHNARPPEKTAEAEVNEFLTCLAVKCVAVKDRVRTTCAI